MKRIFAVVVFLAVASPQTRAFDSGSDGSFGPINVSRYETLTLQVPDNGVINATTVAISFEGTLRFSCNTRNTPIYLLATGNIAIGGVIDVSGMKGTDSFGGPGGCGGYGGGDPSIAGSPGGDGRGPGGGDAAATGTGSQGSFGMGADAYGSSLLMPLIGGSGGGSGVSASYFGGGGGGGGALLIASNTSITLDSSIVACGGIGANINNSPPWAGGSGSAGAVRLVSPKVSGSGAILVAPGTASFYTCDASSGRARIDTLDRSELKIRFPGDPPRSVGSIMHVFPSPQQKLELTTVAGTAIPEGSGPVTIILPQGSQAEQSITVRATNFVGLVPVRVVLTPTSGPRIALDGVIDMAGQAVASTTINATLPANVTLLVNAWTR